MKNLHARLLVLAVAAAAALGASSCQNKAKPTTVPETPTAQAETAKPAAAPVQPAADPFPKAEVEKAPLETSIDDLNRQGVLKTVYFAYDSNDLNDLAKSTLQSNATWLKSHGKYTVEVGGHCDERGSIGYNVALGDRRAQATKQYLVGLGADGGKLVPISYGKEKPADPGHDEAAFAKNRRAEFTIKQ